jgi:hypothetical protein
VIAIPMAAFIATSGVKDIKQVRKRPSHRPTQVEVTH